MVLCYVLRIAAGTRARARLSRFATIKNELPEPARNMASALLRIAGMWVTEAEDGPDGRLSSGPLPTARPCALSCGVISDRVHEQWWPGRGTSGTRTGKSIFTLEMPDGVRRTAVPRARSPRGCRNPVRRSRREQPEAGKDIRFEPVVPVGCACPDRGIHRHRAAPGTPSRSAVRRHGRRDLQHLMTVVSRTVHESHQNRGAGQLGKADNPWHELDLPPEEGHFDSTGLLVRKRRGVARNRHHLIGAKRDDGLRRGFDPARLRLDARPLPVAKHAPRVHEVPEPPLNGRHTCFVFPPPATDVGEREPAGMEHGQGADEVTVVGGAKQDPLAPGQRGLQMLAAADLDQPSQSPGPAPERIMSMTLQDPNRNRSPASRSPSGLSSSPSTWRRSRTISERFSGQYRDVQSGRQQATR